MESGCPVQILKAYYTVNLSECLKDKSGDVCAARVGECEKVPSDSLFNST